MNESPHDRRAGESVVGLDACVEHGQVFRRNVEAQLAHGSAIRPTQSISWKKTASAVCSRAGRQSHGRASRGEGGTWQTRALRCLLDGRWVACVDQLRPDPVPIVRAQIPARDGATSSALDGWTKFGGEFALAVAPEAHRLRANSENGRGLRRPANDLDCSVDLAHAKNSTSVDFPCQHSWLPAVLQPFNFQPWR